MGPSSEAVEAAAEAIQSRWRMSHSAAVRNDAHAALAAALPIIRREIAEALSPIHHPWTPHDGRAEYCVDDGEPWPCPTVQIARGEVSR
jgi:hypothetical protein